MATASQVVKFEPGLHRARRARREEERRREQAVREQRARRERIEQLRAERLLAEPAAWERSAQLRRYLGALHARLGELKPTERERITAWCEWASGWADRSDPVVNTELIAGLDERDELRYPRLG